MDTPFRTLLLLGLLSACTSAPQTTEISCNDAQLICYRGYTIDRRATRDRYGVEGQHAINRNEF